MIPSSNNWPLLSPSSSFLIRAPLTSDDQSSSSEVDLDFHSDYASEDSELEPEPVFKPVARVTGDDDVEESGEESFDEVDGDGFVIRARVPIPNLDSTFDDYEAGNASENEVVLGVDGDGLLSATVVNSNFDPGDIVIVLTSSSEESFETVDGDGFSVRAKRDLDVGLGQYNNLDESVGVKIVNLDNFISFKDVMLGQNGNMGENFKESEVEGLSLQKSDIVYNVEVGERGEMHDNLNLKGDVLGQSYNLDDNLYADEKNDSITKEANFDENVSVQDSNDMNYSLDLEGSLQKSGIVDNVEVVERVDMHDNFDLEGDGLGHNYNLDENFYADEKNDSITKEANFDENVSVGDSNDMNYNLHFEGPSLQKSDIVDNVEVEERVDMHDNLDLEGDGLGHNYILDENVYADEKIDGITREANLVENVSVQDSNDMNYSLDIEDDILGQKSQNDSSNESSNAAEILRNYKRRDFFLLNSSSGENYSEEEYPGDSEADCFVVHSVSSHCGDRKFYSDRNYVEKHGQNGCNYSYENVQESDESETEMIIKDRLSSASINHYVMGKDDSLFTDAHGLSLNDNDDILKSIVADNEIGKDLVDNGSCICTLDDETTEIFGGDLKDNILAVDENLKAKELWLNCHKIAKIGDDEMIKDKEVEIGAVCAEEVGIAAFSDKMNMNSEAKFNTIEMHKDGVDEDMGAASVDEIENVIADSYQKYELVHGYSSISVIAEGSVVDSTVEVVSHQKHKPEEEVTGIPSMTVPEEDTKLLEKVEALKVKFLRIIYNLGFSPHDTVPASVLYRLSLIADTKCYMNIFESIRKKAIDLENEEEDNLNFSCNILVIGKAGVGKSATLNSIFEGEKSPVNTFETATPSVRIIEEVTYGIRIRVLDTPGLGHYLMDQTSNTKILSSVKRHMKKHPPDVVLYIDRLDLQNTISNDLPLFKSITNILGRSIWTNAIITLTHAGKAPPDDSNGLPLSCEEYVNRRSHAIQVLIRQTVNDISSLKPVVLVENHLSRNVLPNSSMWKSELLLLCCSSKILSEANKLDPLNHKNNSQETSWQKLLWSFQTLPIQFLTSVLHSKNHPKLSPDYHHIDLDAVSDVENEKDEYDNLPHFCSLTKSQIAKLSNEHKRAYSEEYDYRVKLSQRIRAKEETRRRKENKISKEESEEALSAIKPATKEIPLPLSFDSENPEYRYRSLDQTSQLYTGYLKDSECFDHDYGFGGVSIHNLVAIAKKFPAEIILKMRKDKKTFSIDFDSSICAKHGMFSSSMASFDIKTTGDQISYILKSQAKFKNFSNKSETSVGISSTFFRDVLAPGVKLEEKLMMRDSLQFDVSTGAARVENELAYGDSLEAALMKRDSCVMGEATPILGLSLVKHQSKFGFRSSLQSDLSIYRNMKMNVGVGMNDGMQGQVGVKLTEHEQVGLVHFLGFISVAISLFKRVRFGE